MRIKGHSGFSLVELLITTALMGLVLVAVYGVYTSTQRAAYTTEEVGEVQQSLRVALDRMSRGIRLAGFLTPVSTPRFVSALGPSIQFRSASTTGSIGRIETCTFTAPDTYVFTLGQEEMVSLFTVGGKARVLRPGTGSEPLAEVFTVTALDPATRQLTVTQTSALDAGFSPGDVLLPYSAGAPNAALQTIGYRLVDDLDTADPEIQLLVRDSTNGGTETLAGNITNLTFSYILESGSEVATVTDIAELDKIVAVRIQLTGRTEKTELLAGGTKNRFVTSLVTIRN